jgi:hypothetical protein
MPGDREGAPFAAREFVLHLLSSLCKAESVAEVFLGH